MASDDFSTVHREDKLFTNPWPPLLVGLGASVLAVLLYAVLGESGTSVRLFVLLSGLLAAGAAIAIRPSSPAVIALAGICAVVGSIAADASWDSFRLLLQVLAAFAGLAAILLLLPRTARRTVVSLMIVLHFGGIATAVTTVSPQPWLSASIWHHFYRYYLEFMYLNNAYHFYSPDPGPATLIWFRMQYADGSTRWVKIPNREDFPLAVNYQRRLSMTESINQLTPPLSVIPDEIAKRRWIASREIPQHPDLSINLQFREPVPYSKRMLEAYARYAARAFKHLEDPEQLVVSMKIYRVIHRIPMPGELLMRGRFDDETMYLPYYQGEYDPDGKLLDPQDNLLYWLIPIYRVPKENANLTGLGGPDFRLSLEDTELKNYLDLHAAQQSGR